MINTFFAGNSLLIIFDYDLGEGSETGLSVATHLRSKVYIDMIFYSGQSQDKLRTMLYENQVDGVFIVHRPTFFDDIVPHIEDHIKKMSDINNIRGVVMSVTSSFDIQLRQLLMAKIEELGEEKIQEMLGGLKNSMSKRLNKRLKNVDKFDCLIKAISDPFLTEFDFVRTTLLKLAESELQEMLKNDGLIHEMQKERNKLAHRQERFTDDGKMHLEHGSHTTEYNFDSFKEIRVKLLQAKNVLEECIYS